MMVRLWGVYAQFQEENPKSFKESIAYMLISRIHDQVICDLLHDSMPRNGLSWGPLNIEFGDHIGDLLVQINPDPSWCRFLSHNYKSSDQKAQVCVMKRSHAHFQGAIQEFVVHEGQNFFLLNSMAQNGLSNLRINKQLWKYKQKHKQKHNQESTNNYWSTNKSINKSITASPGTLSSSLKFGDCHTHCKYLYLQLNLHTSKCRCHGQLRMFLKKVVGKFAVELFNFF
jgi:hypothetical protein